MTEFELFLLILVVLLAWRVVRIERRLGKVDKFEADQRAFRASGMGPFAAYEAAAQVRALRRRVG